MHLLAYFFSQALVGSRDLGALRTWGLWKDLPSRHEEAETCPWVGGGLAKSAWLGHPSPNFLCPTFLGDTGSDCILLHLSVFQSSGVFSGIYYIPTEKAVAPHSSTLAGKIPWTEEPGRLQSTGSQRVGHDFTFTFTFRGLITSAPAFPLYKWESCTFSGIDLYIFIYIYFPIICILLSIHVHI